MTRRTFNIKRANRYAELLRAKYLARELVKVRLLVRTEVIDEKASQIKSGKDHES